MNRIQKLPMTLMAAVVFLGLSATAQAQESPPPAPPPPPASHSSGGGAGIGVGVAESLGVVVGQGVTTAQFVYDQEVWHLEGLLAFGSRSNPNGASRTTNVGFGAGGWYHLHRGAASDFSLGGAIVVNTTSGPGGNSTTITSFDPGAMIRAFVTPNVALSARVGLAFEFGDTAGGGTDIFLTGQPYGTFGITYFFR